MRQGLAREADVDAVAQSAVDDRFNYPEEYLCGRITGALGGRAAEEVVYSNITTGAESDLQQVTAIAHEMVVRWGMSPKVGPLNYSDSRDGAGPWSMQRPYSEATAQLVDDEVKRIADECFAMATELLREHRDKLDALARALLEHDSLGEDEIREVTGLRPSPAVEASRGYST